MQLPTDAPPMMGAEEEADPMAAEETAEAPTLNVTGDMAAALTDGKQPGDEFSATVQLRVVSAADGAAQLEVLDAVPQEAAGGPEETGGAALDSYLATQKPPTI